MHLLFFFFCFFFFCPTQDSALLLFGMRERSIYEITFDRSLSSSLGDKLLPLIKRDTLLTYQQIANSQTRVERFLIECRKTKIKPINY